MRMTRRFLVIFCIWLFSTSCVDSEAGAGVEVESYHVGVGEAFVLKCRLYSFFRESFNNLTVAWSRDGNTSLNETGSRVEAHEDMLWFLPVELSDSGYYGCDIRGPEFPFEMKMFLSVKTSSCSYVNYFNFITLNSPVIISCFGYKEISTLDRQPDVRWFKDCVPIEMNKDKMSTVRGGLYIANVNSVDVGNYTCQINFTHKGKTLIASSLGTTKISPNELMVVETPKVLHPKNESIEAELGHKMVLTCTVFIGLREYTENETLVYWTINNTVIEQYKDKQLIEELKILKEHKDGRYGMYGYLNLTIPEVTNEFYHMPLTCIVLNPQGADRGHVRLIPAPRRAFHLYIIVAIFFPLIVAGLLVYHYFKVDMVLSYRKLSHAFRNEKISDGKLYDAYVSYPKDNSLVSARAAEFALHILPEMLENRHGYQLFIFDRDDLPGEALHSAVEEAIRKSRRLILILTAHQGEGWSQAAFEQQAGLYDALIKDGIKVILVEMDKDINYSLLPESIRYIKQKQGALRWENSRGEQLRTTNTRFWKCLRCSMPPYPERAEPLLPTAPSSQRRRLSLLPPRLRPGTRVL
ncbi:interleukin-1 receptor type 1-like isoform X2 [Lepisosteus oculatus]|uniref:interleukin-1 receptor type 1-like isoform X2 n=1 Tax=Lepisosteus oculatus TaxID=7918 RepID=UPI0035F508B1